MKRISAIRILLILKYKKKEIKKILFECKLSGVDASYMIENYLKDGFGTVLTYVLSFIVGVVIAYLSDDGGHDYVLMVSLLFIMFFIFALLIKEARKVILRAVLYVIYSNRLV